MTCPPITSFSIASLAFFTLTSAAFAAESQCQAVSAAHITPVVELYTSEGCSSCPPADQWLSTLKAPVAQGKVVAQAFHVAYWDYIGWTDRFANPVYTTRQRQIGDKNKLRSIYTPQVVRNGLDWRPDFETGERALTLGTVESSHVLLRLQRTAPDAFEASVAPAEGVDSWSAYWSVTENGHSSRVKAGENAGETLKHDFVVRQYVPVGDYRGPQTLKFNAIASPPGNARQVNLVVFDGKTGKTLQALGVGC